MYFLLFFSSHIHIHCIVLEWYRAEHILLPVLPWRNIVVTQTKKVGWFLQLSNKSGCENSSKFHSLAKLRLQKLYHLIDLDWTLMRSKGWCKRHFCSSICGQKDDDRAHWSFVPFCSWMPYFDCILLVTLLQVMLFYQFITTSDYHKTNENEPCHTHITLIKNIFYC